MPSPSRPEWMLLRVDLEESQSLKTAVRNVFQKRQQFPNDAQALRDWHQLYHWFRRSVHCFVNGLEAFLLHKFDRSLDLLTEACLYTTKLLDTKPGGVKTSVFFGN